MFNAAATPPETTRGQGCRGCSDRCEELPAPSHTSTILFLSTKQYCYLRSIFFTDRFDRNEENSGRTTAEIHERVDELREMAAAGEL